MRVIDKSTGKASNTGWLHFEEGGASNKICSAVSSGEVLTLLGW